MGARLYIDHRGARIRRHHAALEVRLPDAAPRRIPLRGIERVILCPTAEIDVAALNLLWEAGVALLCLSGRRAEAGARFHGAAHGDAQIRLAQYRVWHDPAARESWARELVGLRLRVMRKVAGELGARRRAGGKIMAPAVQALDRAERSLTRAGGLDTLRGIEGAVAAAWFGAIARLFPPSLGFVTRRRRPPPDPVNAVLSLGYTLATAEASRSAVRAGLDPAIGLIHGLAHGREALALDLVEPARPLVDRFAHDLFHRRVLEARHFTQGDGGGVFLGKAGRRSFYEAWEDGVAAQVRALTRMIAREGVRRLRNMPVMGWGDGQTIPI